MLFRSRTPVVESTQLFVRSIGEATDIVEKEMFSFERGDERSEMWQNARTVADGLRVPKAIGDFLVLRAIRESGGTAIAVSDEAIRHAQAELARVEGIFAAPEGAALLAA